MRGTLPRYAVIPTHNRPSELTSLIKSLSEQHCDGVVVVDNASTPPVSVRELQHAANFDVNIAVIRDLEQPPNLSRLWNIGLDAVKLIADFNGEDLWSVSVFNDDTILPPGWFDAMSTALWYDPLNGPAAVSGDVHGLIRQPIVKIEPDRDLMTRMCPWAFMMRGNLNIRGDEELRWWWGDTDIDWRLRQAGGVMILPGYISVNAYANQSTVGPLGEQSGRDRETFAQKWGYNPW